MDDQSDPGQFHTTRWTRVALAKDASAEGRDALRHLCDAYYEPIVAYLRGALRDDDTARDAAHAFFAGMLEGGTIRHAVPERGRFRFYLLGAVKHFLAHRREAELRLKRGAGVAPLSIDTDAPAMQVAEASQLSPEAAYDRQWAITVLARAMQALETECAAEGKEMLLTVLRPWLVGEAAYGDLAAAACRLEISAGAAKVAASRLRQRYREKVKAEISSTLRDATSLDDEMRSLFAALAG